MPPAAENTLVVAQAPLPIVLGPETPEEIRVAGFIDRMIRDKVSMIYWDDRSRDRLLEDPTPLETAVARRVEAMKGEAPDKIVQMLGHFQKKIDTTMDADSLVADLAADALALSRAIPAGLLHDAFQRMLDRWGGGMERRPGVADFKRAIERELRDQEIEVSRLKTGLMRVRGERNRQGQERGR